MEIFNIHLNGEDAKEFCKQTVEFKVKWIMNHTNQQNRELILQWIENPKKDGDCGCGCGGHKEQVKILPNKTKKVRRRKY